MYNSNETIDINNKEDITCFYQSIEAERKYVILSNVIVNLRYVERVYIIEDEE